MLFSNEVGKKIHPYYIELKNHSNSDNSLLQKFERVSSFRNASGFGLLDSKFCSQFKSAPFQSLLELDLAEYLIALKLDIYSENAGPDFKLAINEDISVWIEAVCPTAGNDTPNQYIKTSSDESSKTQLISVPMRDAGFERRITGVLDTKLKAYQKYLKEDIVALDDVKLIAISLDEINTLPLGDELLKIRLKATLFAESSVVIIDSNGCGRNEEMSLLTQANSEIDCLFFEGNDLVQGVIFKGHDDFYYFDPDNREGITLRYYLKKLIAQ